jgi:hypothetical protein
MTTTQLNKEYNKIAKRYFELEEKDFRTFDEQRELDAIEVRMSEINAAMEMVVKYIILLTIHRNLAGEIKIN